MTCNDCKKGKRHYHKIEFKTDFWQPTPDAGWVCYCGKSYAHYHYDHKLVLIHEVPEILNRLSKR